MTTWVDEPRGGRERGPRGLARAWVEVLVRPRRFFHTGVAPGDQAPGLVFAVAVAVVFLGTRFLTVPASRPGFFRSEAASVVVGLLVVALVVVPVALHLVAALEVVVLVAVARDRAGVSETVQVVAYATAPMALAGVGVDPVGAGGTTIRTAVAGWQLLCALYGVGLLVVGMRVVHDLSLPRAVVAALVPGIVVFGYFFGGVSAVAQLTGVEVVDASPPAGSEGRVADMETQLRGGR